MKKVSRPNCSFCFNKHHRTDFYVLLDKNESWICTKTGKKFLGPAIVEVEQKGIRQKVTKHSLKSKKMWEEIGSFARAGIWALNTRNVAPFLPKDLLVLSKRYCNMSDSQRSQLKKLAKKVARSRMRRG